MLFIAGYHGSGKTTAAEYLDRERGYIHVERSSVLSEIKSLEGKEKPMRIWREEKKRQLGNYVLEDMIVGKIRSQYTSAVQQDKVAKVVVTGNRALDEIRYTASSLSDIDDSESQIIALKADVRILFERYVKRARLNADRNLTFENFKDMVKREKDAGIEEIFNAADHTIYNTGSRPDLIQSIDTLLFSQI